jgi:hypothetical protein
MAPLAEVCGKVITSGQNIQQIQQDTIIFPGNSSY